MLLRLFTLVFITLFLTISICLYFSSQRTFEAKFKNIDGLPKGAPVTALGVKIGEVIRTKPTKDGIIVTIKLTNKSAPIPEAGSQLTITSFRPNQGRVLEIVSPSTKLSETKAFLIQEPITTATWLHAAIDLLEGLKSFSQTIVKYVTPENFQIARSALQETSFLLNRIANDLFEYEQHLTEVKEKLKSKTTETYELITRLTKTVKSLNELINDKEFALSFKNEVATFSGDLSSIAGNITKPEFLENLKSFKTDILDYLNEIDVSLTEKDQKIKNLPLKEKLRSFNEHVSNLNDFYDKISTEDIQNIKEAAKKAREITTMAAKQN